MIQADTRAPASAEQLSRVLDLRTIPKLPRAVAAVGHAVDHHDARSLPGIKPLDLISDLVDAPFLLHVA